mmetsp:Transcript_6013/g.12711  ORF Transcript_6013/g.12711 Transcript_6013/m.12711 type:complete len:96 (-) Transcript_6013:228-515(-)
MGRLQSRSSISMVAWQLRELAAGLPSVGSWPAICPSPADGLGQCQSSSWPAICRHGRAGRRRGRRLEQLSRGLATQTSSELARAAICRHGRTGRR